MVDLNCGFLHMIPKENFATTRTQVACFPFVGKEVELWSQRGYFCLESTIEIFAKHYRCCVLMLRKAHAGNYNAPINSLLFQVLMNMV